MKRYIVGISGASGAILAVTLVSELARLGHHVDVIISPAAQKTLYYELETKSFLATIPSNLHKNILIHRITSIESSLSSGSTLVDATIIVPCSVATIAAISCGLSDNLLRRVADVALKEKRPLILVPRETPLSAIHLENLLKLAQNGAVILPPMPTWYFRPETANDIANDIVGKILAILQLDSPLIKRWENPH
ncbi:aromatic acid decarboxylase [Chlamydia muridarum str. Nigg]|jgi:polyprenyl P-hydroxybenzoate and phenylacrylic acid decarboxylases|uniref:Flavin prenyltransferase UbiX n=2 Tax=Chlamydia muridarum TaxID=83560 RepID=UBIX_CHLMU|nr:flavin prenyltransferase UbiX [Chlamydia muridarum]Q9PKH2.1 RecName: Full=Flavin prenyltransferase UbiX [Chlamydia muridarum str. Nigg]UFW99749.1 UbiX family flavin prenyltransferase [Chlamydia trachomatis]AAF73564.1 phenylacrylic acid decarboxylase [Chlamydia muridarum str. Nigg]AHH22881.1 aromatic acid decarboxylase [Chlamydia muridarum str. Nigg3 CMUT3-5]AHH23806.1 aromatic acid decarboxylase [Chlamydia muridarum str. Nigg CM972]AID38015.1 aromatic acid decarboxylase [Chlamydia muridaru